MLAAVGDVNCSALRPNGDDDDDAGGGGDVIVLGDSGSSLGTFSFLRRGCGTGAGFLVGDAGGPA